ncbi:hypothetical protein D3C72_685430 [compost metagenome]
MWLTLLLLMPSASAMAMPLAPSSGSPGTHRPWKSWLTGLAPGSVCWPTATFREAAGTPGA